MRERGRKGPHPRLLTPDRMRLLLLDHRDSYSDLLKQLFWEASGEEPLFVSANAASLLALDENDWDAAILSPGPGHPAKAEDFGATLRFLLSHPSRPMLGVCLGHQGMALAAGAGIESLARPWHGQSSRIRHDGQGLFAGIPQGFAAVRYHSLIVSPETGPRPFRVTAQAEEDGAIMGLAFRDRPWHGLQFHPESIGTSEGMALARNFLTLARASAGRPLAQNPPTDKSPAGKPKGDRENTVTPAIPPRPQGRRERHVREFSAYTAEHVFATLFSDHPDAFWLDPASHSDREGQTAGWAATRLGCAAEWIEMRAGGLIWNAPNDGKAEHFHCAPLETLEAWRREDASDAPDWIGYFTYELGALCQDASEAWAPDAGTVIGQFLIPQIEWILNPENHTWLAAFYGSGHAAQAWFDQAKIALGPHPTSHPGTVTPRFPPSPAAWAFSLNRAEYGQAFQSLQASLRAGDTYEACLTLTASRRSDLDALTAYRRLRRLNPAPYAAFWRRGDLALLSSSPELFLAGAADGGLRSRPIKGTRRRGNDPASDLAQRDDLASHPKDLAENLMITDLVRNDLGRVCRPGSVQVTSLRAVEAHPRVWQMVSEVRGVLRSGLGLAAALRACFPGGSMTGAPKSRSMDLLRGLEKRPRGLYSGAFGTLSQNGAFTLAMTIRSLVRQGDTYQAGCGGAIVVASDEESEWREALLKAEVLLQALE